MFFSKVWILILSFIGVLAIGSILVANRPAEFFLQKTYQDNVVDLFQAAFDKELEWESRQVLDGLARIRMDGRILDIFEKKLDPFKIKDVFKKFADTLNMDELILADNEGKVVTATTKNRKSIAGLSGFIEAKKGFHNDNSFLVDGILYMTWSVPVLASTHKSTHGVLMGIRKLDTEFLSYHLERMGYSQDKRPVELAIFVKDKSVLSTGSIEIAQKLPLLYAKNIKDIRNPQKGFSSVIKISGKTDNYAVILGMLRGAATNPVFDSSKKLPELPDTGVFYAVIWKLPKAMGPFAFLDKLIPQSELLKGFPWGMFIAATVVILFLGIFIVLWEGDLPLRKLIKRAKEVSSGELALINDQEFRGRFSSLARAINEALEKAQASGGGNVQQKSVDELLGGEEKSTGERASLRDGGPPPPPVGGKPLVYPEMKKVSLPGQSDRVASSRPDLPPIPSSREIPAVEAPSVKEESQPPQPPLPGDDPSEYFNFVCNEYRELKLKLEGNIDGFNDEDFIKKLSDSTDNIRAKAKCEQVILEVYERDGKAGLKAVPKRK
ncbi:MAG: methyl-accepting chemotaxis protein [Deltaproteobacteria bacterium]|nr:methyl-accepting chemotaxis protein [Deltaproteobacteria bacterium]